MAMDAGDLMTMTAEVLMTDAADAAVEAEAPMTDAADAAETPMTGAAVMAEIPGAAAEIIRMTENAVRSGKVSGTAGAAATGRAFTMPPGAGIPETASAAVIKFL